MDIGKTKKLKIEIEIITNLNLTSEMINEKIASFIEDADELGFDVVIALPNTSVTCLEKQ